jgi:hypothetical protein
MAKTKSEKNKKTEKYLLKNAAPKKRPASRA